MSTVVFVHAHPDDEALLTGGTMAQLAAQGHRVVLVSATAGEAGLAAQHYTRAGGLGIQRRHELDAAAQALGCARVVVLGYADSGMAGEPTGAADAFATANVDEAAARLAEILDVERADAVVGYDAAGGYGHPDHQQVHVVTRAATALAGTPALFEATVDRRALQRAVRALARTPLRRRFPALDPSMYDGCFADPAEITHCIDVSAHLAAKRAALAAHVSQATADGEVRSLAGMLRLPAPLFRIAFGREWFVEVGRSPGRRRARELLEPVRQ